MTTLPLLVLPAPSDGGEVRRVLEAWSGAGLLAPFVWACGEAGPQPGRKVEVIESGVATAVDLFEVVGSQPFALVRLVTVALHSPDACDDYAERAERIADAIEQALAASQRLVRLNVVVPASGAVRLPGSQLLVGWNANVVVSSEDRISPEHADRLVGAEAGYAEHAALACSTLAGLWTAMQGSGPLDDSTLSHVQGQSHVVVARSFGRLVRAPGVLDDVLATLYSSRGTAAWAAAAAGGVPARDPALVTDRTTSWLLDGGAATLHHHPAAPLRAPVLSRPGLFATLRAMVRHMGGRRERLVLPARPEREPQVAEAARKLMSDQSEQATRGGMLPAPEVDAAAAAGRIAAQLLADIGSPPSPPASPELWATLRQTCFGLLDGGDLPSGLDAPRDGATREVVVDATFVAPPLDVLRVEPGGDLLVVESPAAEEPGHLFGAHVRACDPFQAARLRSATEDDLRAARGAADEELAARYEAALQTLDGWVGRHRTALLWRVAEHLSAQAEQARSAFHVAVATVAKGPRKGDPTAGSRARRRLRFWWAAVALPALYSIYGAADLNLGPGETFGTVERIVTVVALWFVGWALAFFDYHRRVLALEHDQAKALYDYLTAVRRAEHDAHETVRLTSTYDQLRDWADIVSWLVHRPEGHIPSPARGTTDELPHPAALRPAVGEADAESLTRTAARIGRDVFACGWLGGLYATRAAASMLALKLRGGGDPEAPDPDPDRDLSFPAPRHRLLADVSVGRYADAWRDGVRRVAAETVAALPPADVVPGVDELPPAATVPASRATRQPTGAFLAAILPGADGATKEMFSTSLWTPQARIAGAGEVARSFTWQPQALVGAARERVTPQSTPSREGQDLEILTLRVDTSQSHHFGDLVLFSTPPSIHDDQTLAAVDALDVG